MHRPTTVSAVSYGEADRKRRRGLAHPTPSIGGLGLGPLESLLFGSRTQLLNSTLATFAFPPIRTLFGLNSFTMHQ